MGKGRLEAFSDGVLAIIITIMVLELHAPRETDIAALHPLLPVLLSYVLSFVFLGIYWNNHHHMLTCTRRVTGGILWANLHLLFWLSLIPFTTGWMGENHFAPLPTAVYGFVLLMAGVAFTVLERVLVAEQAPGSKLARALGGDDTKERLSMAAYAAAIPLAFVNQWISDAVYVGVALMWLVPDRRMESQLAD